MKPASLLLYLQQLDTDPRPGSEGHSPHSRALFLYDSLYYYPRIRTYELVLSGGPNAMLYAVPFLIFLVCDDDQPVSIPSI